MQITLFGLTVNFRVFVSGPSGEERAGFSLLSWSDGSLSAAALRSDVLLPVPQPSALTAGLRILGDTRVVCGPRPIEDPGLVPGSHAGLQ